MAVALSQDVRGAWVYADPEQVSLRLAVHALTSWDMLPFDAWVGDSAHWAAHADVRDKLTQERDKLTQVYREHFADNDRIVQAAEALYQVADKARMYLKGHALEHRAVEVRDKARASAAKPRPGRTSPIHARVVAILAAERRRGRALLTILSDWAKTGPIDGVRLEYDRTTEMYVVADENAFDDMVGSFSMRQMKTLFVNAGNRTRKT